eukprot:TRINITY_DN3254_c1_g1_i1.p1 TRINITY_DN3254_c1_g1~~TRINITY_DN3254_c1_g1_i1.p1  ORF type:complete len:377 (+),score=76.92 TRINITY_DN3254_c1_g1_i1:57-1187(+)
MGNLLSSAVSVTLSVLVVMLAVFCGVAWYRAGGGICCAETINGPNDSNNNHGNDEDVIGLPSNSHNNGRTSSHSHIGESVSARAQREFFAIEKELNDGGFDFAQLAHNIEKNRYSNVLANTHTRVVLQSDDPAHDYINANFIRPPHTPLSSSLSHSQHQQEQEQDQNTPMYIATQAPLPSTFTDFWQMVYEQRSAVVVMLTRLHESGREKAHLYWPSQSGEWKRFGNIEVVLDREETISEEVMVRYLRLRKGDTEHSVVQIHYTGWPDFGIPESTRTFQEIIHLIDRFNNMPVEPETDVASNGPIITHCSAGIGRTGTLIAAHMAMHQVATGVPAETVDVKQIVSSLREQRAGMVQTLGQYQFLLALSRDLATSNV